LTSEAPNIQFRTVIWCFFISHKGEIILLDGVKVKRYVTNEATQYLVVGMLIERAPSLNRNEGYVMNLECKLGDRMKPINFMPFFTEAKFMLN